MIGEGKVKGLTFKDLQETQEIRIRSKMVVDATGPWVDRAGQISWVIPGCGAG